MSDAACFVEIDWGGRQVHIEHQWIASERSAAPLIVFLHEGLGSLAMWKDFPQRLCVASGCRGLVYSRPGYGRSTPRDLDEAWGLDFMHRQAHEVLPALLNALGIDTSTQPIWLFGHSDGGSIALLYAARYADHLAGAIVLAPHILVEDLSVASIEVARTAYLETDLRQRLAKYHDDPDSAFWGWNQIWLHPPFKEWSIESEIASISCPLLAVQGREDEYGTLAQIHGIARRVPQTELLELSHCGHSPHRDQADRLITAACAFIRQQALATVDEMGKRIRRASKLKGRQPEVPALQEVRTLIGSAPHRRDLLIEYLHKLNDAYRCLHERHLVALAKEMNIPMAEVYEVATFYHHFEVVKGDEQAPGLTVRVCDGLSCEMAGAKDLLARLPALLGSADIRVVAAPCLGRCEQAPVAVVHQRPVPRATVESILLASNSALAQHPQAQAAIQFVASEHAERSVSPEPHAIEVAPGYTGHDTYLAHGGYALAAALHQGERDVEPVIQAMENSGLRGLGGAGFPAGRKWRIVRDQPAPRLMAVNIDEGEPGTFKDRTYLERDPHRFLEGVLIAAQVVGIDACYIYLRDEYHGCRAILEAELAQLQANPPYPLPMIELRRGAGAYICGEESAMIESLEGKRGEPRMRPPYLAEVGLFNRPTLVHNFETLYWVRDIVEKGPDWFSSFGRHGRKGLRSFSVSGRVKQPGVKLAPAGITLLELVNEYCGGMLDGHTLYAYLPGGASGGIFPASHANVPLDFDSLQPHGGFIGSAAVIVLSQHDKARDAALNMMRFFAHESCGQCTPCRVGTAKAAKLMEAPVWDNNTLEDLRMVMTDASICGLGQAAPNPVRCVQKYFPQEIA